MLDSRSFSVESVAIRAARLLAIITAWSVAAALVMGYYFSPIGAVSQPTFDDLIEFGCAFTITGAAAAAVVLVLGGKGWWAAEIALAFGLLMATAAVLAYLALWAAPWTVRSRMDAWSFLRLQRAVLHCGEASVTFLVPMGLGAGVLVGAIAGGLIVMARRRPQPSRWIALGLLVACAAGPVRPILFDLVFVWGMVVRWVLAAWPMTLEHVWATAASFGAIIGALVACLSIHLARGHRSGSVSRAAGAGVPALPLSPRGNEESATRAGVLREESDGGMARILPVPEA